MPPPNCVSPRSAGMGDLAALGEATSRPNRFTTFPARSTSRAFVSSSCTSAAEAAACGIVPWSAATSAAPTQTGATGESDGSNPTCVDPRTLPPPNGNIASSRNVTRNAAPGLLVPSHGSHSETYVVAHCHRQGDLAAHRRLKDEVGSLRWVGSHSIVHMECVRPQAP